MFRKRQANKNGIARRTLNISCSDISYIDEIWVPMDEKKAQFLYGTPHFFNCSKLLNYKLIWHENNPLYKFNAPTNHLLEAKFQTKMAQFVVIEIDNIKLYLFMGRLFHFHFLLVLSAKRPLYFIPSLYKSNKIGKM